MLRIFEKLDDENQKFKLSLYKQLTMALICALIACLIAIVSHFYFVFYQIYLDPSYWSLFWFVKDGSIQFLMLIMAMSIIWIFRPHRHSLKYAYSMEVNVDDRDHEHDINKSQV